MLDKLANEGFATYIGNGVAIPHGMEDGKKYINDVSIEEDPNSTWRHNLFFELVSPTKGNFYWPTVVIVDGKNKKVAQLPGFKSKQQLLRSLGRLK